jgi:Methyltransferase domain
VTEQFPVPQGVRTSVLLHELRLLQQYAAGRRALEIGTHLGFTCIGMALAGADVTSVDPHCEGPFDQPDTWPPFVENARRHGFDPTRLHPWRPGGDGRILALRTTIEEFAAVDQMLTGPGPRWDLVFIDGDHVWPHPRHDVNYAAAHLTPGGVIAMHDVTPNWPGVWRAAHELEKSGLGVKLDQVGTLAVYRLAG